jgi:hypothetical protein
MSVPATLDEACSREWLSSVTGLDIREVVVGPVDNRVSTNAPVRVGLADGHTFDLWIKGYFDEAGTALRYAGIPEVHFYRELATRARLRTPKCRYAAIDPASSFNVLVTDDVGSDATFPDGRVPCTVDQTAQSLEELAGLHASTWMDQRSATATWLDSRLELYTVRRGLADIGQNFEGVCGAGVPAGVRDPERLLSAFNTLAVDVAVADPWCVVHGDAHIRNVYLDGTGRPSFIDWQLVQRGPWYLDVGYHIATMLSIDDRRANQDALLAHYIDHLVSGGVDRPASLEIERGLCRSFVHGFYLWAITRRVDPAAITALLERLGTAVEDHDAYKELES